MLLSEVPPHRPTQSPACPSPRTRECVSFLLPSKQHPPAMPMLMRSNCPCVHTHLRACPHPPLCLRALPPCVFHVSSRVLATPLPPPTLPKQRLSRSHNSHQHCSSCSNRREAAMLRPPAHHPPCLYRPLLACVCAPPEISPSPSPVHCRFATLPSAPTVHSHPIFSSRPAPLPVLPANKAAHLM